MEIEKKYKLKELHYDATNQEIIDRLNNLAKIIGDVVYIEEQNLELFRILGKVLGIDTKDEDE